MNLPAALEDFGGREVPKSLLQKAAEVRDKGGFVKLNNLMQELPSSLMRNKEILDEVRVSTHVYVGVMVFAYVSLGVFVGGYVRAYGCLRIFVWFFVCECFFSLNRHHTTTQADKMLDEEQASDDQLRQQFKERWTRTASRQLTESIRSEASKYRTIINNAINSDSVVKERYAKHIEGIKLLSLSAVSASSMVFVLTVQFVLINYKLILIQL